MPLPAKEQYAWFMIKKCWFCSFLRSAWWRISLAPGLFVWYFELFDYFQTVRSLAILLVSFSCHSLAFFAILLPLSVAIVALCVIAAGYSLLGLKIKARSRAATLSLLHSELSPVNPLISQAMIVVRARACCDRFVRSPRLPEICTKMRRIKNKRYTHNKSFKKTKRHYVWSGALAELWASAFLDHFWCVNLAGYSTIRSSCTD